MTFPIAVVSSDWHLERNAYVGRPDMWGDSYHALKQLVDRAVEHRAPLIGAGDLFDKAHPDAFTVKVAMEEIDRLADNDLAFYFTTGQHERSRHEQWMSVSDWSSHLHKRSVRLGSHEVYGL